MPVWLGVILATTLAFLTVPLVVIFVFSFNSSTSLSRMEGVSFRWYETAFTNPDVLGSLGMSFGIALGAMLISVVLGTGLAWAFVRGNRKFTKPVEGITLTTLITPELATAIGLLTLFTVANFELSWLTVLIGHSMFTLVYVTVIIGNRVRSMDRSLEEAAYDLGASGFACFRYVVLPTLAPAVMSAAALAFVLSFGDFVTSVFLTGTDLSPLPVRIYGMLRFGLTPEINAIGAMLTMVTVVVGLVGVWLSTRTSAQSRRPKNSRKSQLVH
ncbi:MULTISPECIES: ABC transporter permease [unclassified Leucobacter]|uniref:ABC transporter permease n=1 Tax=unclassified Leucobacter TaxID=2621730 RepID=UPI00165E546F|nr:MULTISPECIES: ABC transporter permease [unclassified Leucobacter]MBC9936527.1 ABC transporter permease [Leucobacter sp. cx-87]